jgi:hypothetical protein
MRQCEAIAPLLTGVRIGIETDFDCGRNGATLYLIGQAYLHLGMSRPLRLEFADALYHVTARGNAREDISRDDGDRATFLDLLGRRHAQAYRCVINLLRRVVNDPIVKVARRAGISAPRVAQIQAAGKALGRKGGCGNCWITIR